MPVDLEFLQHGVRSVSTCLSEERRVLPLRMAELVQLKTEVWGPHVFHMASPEAEMFKRKLHIGSS